MEPTRKRLLLTLAIAAAVGIAWLGFSPKFKDTAEESVAGRPVEEPGRGPTLAVAKPPLTPTPSARTGGPQTGAVPPAPYRGPLHVRGRVVGPAGASLADAMVHIGVIESDAERRIIAKERMGHDGVFRVDVPDGGPASSVRVIAVVPGYPTRWEDVVPDAEGNVRVEIPLLMDLAERHASDSELRVLDGAGKPVAGLPVFVEAAPYDLACLDANRMDDGLAVLYWPTHMQGLRGTARTDADGRFLIRGLTCGGCARAGSESGDFFILDDRANRELRLVSGGAPLHTAAAANLVLHVVAEGSGNPIPEFTVRGAPEGGRPWAREGKKGALAVTWPMPQVSDRVSLDLSVESSGFVPRSLLLTTVPGTTRIDAQISLRSMSVEESGRVVVRLAGRGAPLIPGDLRMELRVPGRTSAAQEVDLAADATPSHAAPAAPGTWDYVVRPQLAGAEALASRGSVTISPGREAVIVWDVPAIGTLRIQGNDVRVEWRGSLKSAADGSLLSKDLPPFRPLLVPVGVWSFWCEDEMGKVRGGRQSVTIEEGKETTVIVGAD